ncbi:RDD family protein [Fredinandcohnia humi]
MDNRAGFWIRFIALLIDSIILGIVEWIISALLGAITDPEGILISIINLIIGILYFVVFQTKYNGQTLGKKITGIRVINVDGGNVSIGKMALREIIGKTISAIILLIGYLMAAGKAKRALHDYLAKTVVVRAE